MLRRVIMNFEADSQFHFLDDVSTHRRATVSDIRRNQPLVYMASGCWYRIPYTL